MQIMEPITVADVRAFLSLNIHDTEEDALREMLIRGARSQAETYLRRHVAQQEVKTTIQRAPRSDMWQAPDTIALLHRVTVDNEDVTDQCNIHGGDVITHPVGFTVVIEYTCEEYCPPEITTALLMMVRNSYTDRSANPLTDEVRALLAPHRLLRI